MNRDRSNTSEIECRVAAQTKCPQDCIDMLPDSEGFLTPVAAPSKCIYCGVCLDTCPERVLVVKNTNRQAYLAEGRDKKLIHFSASGGVFATIAKYVIDSLGGSVFGCAFDRDMRARHIGVQSLEGLADAGFKICTK